MDLILGLVHQLQDSVLRLVHQRQVTILRLVLHYSALHLVDQLQDFAQRLVLGDQEEQRHQFGTGIQVHNRMAIRHLTCLHVFEDFAGKINNLLLWF